MSVNSATSSTPAGQLPDTISLPYIGLSFIVSFSANALLFGKPAAICALSGAAAATTALLIELAVPFFRFFVSDQTALHGMVGLTQVITFLAFPSMASGYFGVNFDTVRTIGYSILSRILGLEAYIVCAV